MSRVLPDPLVGQASPGVLRVYRSLKSIPGEALTSWVALPLPSEFPRPEFLIVHENRTAILVAVSGAGPSDAAEAAQGGLFSSATARSQFAAAERTVITNFIRRATGDPDGKSPGVFGLVVFPEVDHALLEQIFPANPHEGVYFLGKDHLGAEAFADCLRQFAGHGGAEIDRLRTWFTPESVVPDRFTLRSRIARRVGAELTRHLLDYDQEAWAKNKLRLAGESATLAEEAPSYGTAALVTGVAGSGKSLVLLFRACTQARLDPGSRSLVLTHNRALRQELEERFGDLGRPPNVDWETFSSWAWNSLARAGRRWTLIQYGDRDALVTQAALPVWGPVSRRRVEFLRDEFDWIQDRALISLDAYLAAERTGRGARLSSASRRQVFEVFTSYRALVDAAGVEDWSGLAARFWRDLEAEKIAMPPYDFIYVDEAQFFAPVWFRCVLRALRPGRGRLLLAADPTQGFLKRRASWTAAGLDLRGRSTRLRRSYRNTRPILEFARNFYLSRLEDDELAELNLPEDSELSSAPDGEWPRLEILTARQDEVTRVGHEIRAFLAEGGLPEAVLVLVADGRAAAATVRTLADHLGDDRVTDARESLRAGRVRVAAVDAATGLEAPIVFVIGASALLAGEDDLQIPPDHRSELVRDNTRRLYMAFTRAGSRLVVTWVGPAPGWGRSGATPGG